MYFYWPKIAASIQVRLLYKTLRYIGQKDDSRCFNNNNNNNFIRMTQRLTAYYGVRHIEG